MKSPKKVLIMGDSVSVGVGDSGANFEGLGWGMRIAEMIEADRSLNIAENGAKVADFQLRQSQIVHSFRPDLVVVSVGSNDILRSSFNAKRIFSQLHESFQKISKVCCTVLLLVPPDPLHFAPAPKFLRQALSLRHQQLLQVFKLLEENELVKLVLVTPEEVAHQKNLWHIDRMHPSPIGHQYLAMKSLQCLEIYPKRILEIEDEGRNLKQKIFWLLIAGSMWFLKRSVDLIPSLIWLGIKFRYFHRFKDDTFLDLLGRSRILETVPSSNFKNSNFN